MYIYNKLNIYLKIMTIGRKIGHTAGCSHKFHIKCNAMLKTIQISFIYLM